MINTIPSESLGVAAVIASIGPPTVASEAWHRICSTVTLDDCTDPDVLAMLPMIWSHTVSMQPSDPEAARLRGIHHQRWCAARIAARDVVDGVERLRQAGIDARLGGGIALAARAYPDLGFRPLANSVVLVPQQQFDEAVRAMRVSERGLDPGGRNRPFPARRPIRWTTPGGFNVVIASRPTPWFADMPAASVDLMIDDRAVPGLTPEDELLAVLSGTVLDVRPSSLLWVVDAAQLAATGTVNTEQLIDIIRREQLAPVVLPRLRYLADDFGVEFGTGLIASVAALPHKFRDRHLARWAIGTVGSSSLHARARRLGMRWLVLSRRSPLWRSVTSFPGYLRS